MSTVEQKKAKTVAPKKIRVAGVVYEKLPRKIRVNGKVYEMVEPKTAAAKKPAAKAEAKKPAAKAKK